MTAPAPRRGAVLATAIGGTGAFVLGWGGWSSLLQHPARVAFVVVIFAVTGAALASPVNLSSGEREDTASRWLFVPTLVGTTLIAWLVPWLDRRDLWTLDGDAVRWLGVALLAVGGALRVWPMFVLGHRFSGLVAIQPGHELVTEGPYRYVRHPSYLGMILGLIGWALVFRSSVGLLAAALGMPLLVARIEAEEALLAARFGDAYGEYRSRTRRLIPSVY